MFRIKLPLTIIVMLTLVTLSFSQASLPLNTGYNYSTYSVYPVTANDDYWIRIASYPPVTSTSPVGPSWAIAYTGGALPMTTNTGVASMWISAYGPTFNSASGVSDGYPGYAIYRKCFCLSQGYGEVAIEGGGSLPGGARADNNVQIWINSVMNTVLSPSYGNFMPTDLALPVNYNNLNAFKPGPNCLYALVEDGGIATGFNLAANLVTSGSAPIIPAKGPDRTYEPCGCSTGSTTTKGPVSMKTPTAGARTAKANDDEIVKEIIKLAETRRKERTAVAPKN